MLQNLLFRKVFYAINPFTLKTQNLLFSNVFYAIRPLKQCNLPYTKGRHAAWDPRPRFYMVSFLIIKLPTL